MAALWRLQAYLRPYLGGLLLGSLLLAVGGGLMAAIVSTVKPLVNRVLLPAGAAVASPEAAAPGPPVTPDILEQVRSWLPRQGWDAWVSEHAFLQVPLLLLALFFVRGVFLYFGQYLTLRAGASVIRDVRSDLAEAVAYQSLAFFRTHPTGLILSRVLSDVERLQRVSTTVLIDAVRVGTMVPFLLLTALLHEWRLALPALVVVPLLGYPMVRLGRRLRRASTVSQESMAEVANRLTEAVGGVKVVQGFGMERHEVGRFRRAVDRMLGADLRAGRAAALSPAVMELLAAVAGAGLFYVSGLHIARGNLDPGDFAVVLFCLGLLFASVRRLNTLYADVQRARAAAERVFDILDREREIRDLPDARPLPPFADTIRFQDVAFSYGDDPVLDGIDLEIRRGEMLALVGPSGSGKSTLAHLLPRFYDPTRGSVCIDGHDLRRVTLASLREQIAMVTQETILFDDTVRNNIAYGRTDVSLERVRQAARAAHADTFIQALPQGYDTPLGEGGARLSMGQRQRITIARALLKAPPILILDEATSALDTESEAEVQRALEALLQGRTSIVIAHRLSTVRRADRIIVLEAGRIVERGTHAELLQREGIYARLHALQFRDEEVSG